MDELEARIAARLTAALEMCERTGVQVGGEGVGMARYDNTDEPVVRLTLDEVAAIAAAEARAWF
ncbi:hypothetical protein AB0M54_24235 [Actinoplanes sp. NPDC051470]|uniref:hypothetical protein n=1 Tax=Actinoplanes sp. NPDC051470 TaxID=3157224 RepID=UPI00343384F6